MKGLELNVSKQNNMTVLEYRLGAADVYDDRVSDKVAQLGNIIPFQYKDEDGKRSVVSYVHDETSLEVLLKRTLRKPEVLAVLRGLLYAFEIGAAGVQICYLVRDPRYIYVNPETLTVRCVMVPVKQDALAQSDIPDFFRNVVSHMRFDENDRDNYAARILTLINTDHYSNMKLKELVEAEMEKLGIFYTRDEGLRMAFAGGPAPGGQNRGVKVSRVGVMNNQRQNMPQGMPMNGGVPPYVPQPMMPPQGMPMNGSVPPRAPQPMMPPQGMPMNGSVPPRAPQPMMPPQGMPMNGSVPPHAPQPMPAPAPAPDMPKSAPAPAPDMPIPMPASAPVPAPDMPKPMPAPAPVPAPDMPKPQPASAPVPAPDMPKPNGGLMGQLNGTRPVPHLIRKKTGEIINITKPEFVIGKSKTKADYAIENNSAVSREHCTIVQHDGVNYIKDNNSTNHTYLNGVELQPGKEVLLKHKTEIRMGDEEFIFLLRKGD